MTLASSSVETYTTENFVIGMEVLTDSEVVLTNQTIEQYAPLGRVTASGKLIESKSDAVDGSEVPVAIAVHAIDTTGADGTHPVYKGGKFNADLVDWDVSWTAVQKEGAFDGTPIALDSPA